MSAPSNAAVLYPREQSLADAADMLLAQAMECGDYLVTSASNLCPSGLWLLVPLDRTLAAAIEAAGEDLPEDDGLHEPDDGYDEPSDCTEGYQSPAASEAPSWQPWTFQPSEVA
jgi:hypothetical protein